MTIKDPETIWEEKVQTMLNLLNKSNLNQELKDEIENDIFIDRFYSINSFKEYLKKQEAKVKNY